MRIPDNPPAIARCLHLDRLLPTFRKDRLYAQVTASFDPLLNSNDSLTYHKHE